MSAMVENCGVGQFGDEMVLVPAGPFLMGSEDGGPFEHPLHQVDLSAFWMDATLVTNRHFTIFTQDTGYRTDAETRGEAWGYDGYEFRSIKGLSWRSFCRDRENHPVVMVSWNDAEAFARWAGKRLPSEAEWEKASRGGLSNQRYPWGSDAPNGCQCPFALSPTQIPPTSSVRSFPPNGIGMYEIVGNVWQWCADWYGEDYYRISTRQSPVGPPTGASRVRRGGAWNVIQPFRLRCANRGAFDPDSCAPNIGFRCAADVTE
jgi:formylglycine-generating enzyme required for sulfatase activity